MEVELEFDMSEFNKQLQQFILYSGRSIEEEFERQVKLLLRTVVDITPPAHGKGTKGKAGKMGRSKIVGDLVGRKGTRRNRRSGIFTVLSDDLVDHALETGLYDSSDNVRLWVRKDGTVYGTQTHLFRPDATLSEMRYHHKRYFKKGEMSKAGTFTRDIGRWRWIDQMIVRESTFKKYLRSQQRKVGFYAAGFRPALERMGIKTPTYMRNHPAIGSFSLDLDNDLFSMKATNKVGYGRIDRQLQRKIQWAVNVQAAKMERQLPYLIRKHEKIVN